MAMPFKMIAGTFIPQGFFYQNEIGWFSFFNYLSAVRHQVKYRPTPQDNLQSPGICLSSKNMSSQFSDSKIVAGFLWYYGQSGRHKLSQQMEQKIVVAFYTWVSSNKPFPEVEFYPRVLVPAQIV
jgi:hypothetical protein